MEFLLKSLAPFLAPIITPIVTLWVSTNHSKLNMKEKVELVDKLSEKLTLKDKYAVTELFRLRYGKIYDYADIVKIMKHDKSSKLLYILENSDYDVMYYINGQAKITFSIYRFLYKLVLILTTVLSVLLFPVGFIILYFLFSFDAGFNFENILNFFMGILYFLIGFYGFRILKVSINCSRYINELKVK